jgi:hypothetical protein
MHSIVRSKGAVLGAAAKGGMLAGGLMLSTVRGTLPGAAVKGALYWLISTEYLSPGALPSGIWSR